VKRLTKEKKGIYSLENRMISFNIGHVVYLFLIYYFFGLSILYVHIGYSLFITLMAESTNYIEHYGLNRKKDEQGIYESINIRHSWNAP
jgi:alkane 1-monooxygenase